jgi:hypothetical protein
LYPTFSPVFANEAVRLAGMGGAFVGLYNAEGAIFGNPAGLINVQANNLSVALSAQNLDYESLPVGKDERMNKRLSFRLSPSVCYSGAIGDFGISLGYIDDLDNRSTIFRIENTEAEYIVDERKFISDTDTILEYDFFREKGAILSVGCVLDPVRRDSQSTKRRDSQSTKRRDSQSIKLAVGIRVKYSRQIIKKGTIHRPMRLTAVHGEEINRNDPTKLLPAIINNLDIEDAIERFRAGEDGYEDVVADLSGGGFDLDLGMQVKLSDLGNVSAGFMLDHLIQRRIVNPQPCRIRFGLGARSGEWLIASLDLQKALDNGGLNVNIGGEALCKWHRWFSGGIMVRSGFAHESSSETKDRISIGLGLILGDSHWDYALVKPLDDSPIRKATHMLSSTTRF